MDNSLRDKSLTIMCQIREMMLAKASEKRVTYWLTLQPVTANAMLMDGKTTVEVFSDGWMIKVMMP